MLRLCVIFWLFFASIATAAEMPNAKDMLSAYQNQGQNAAGEFKVVLMLVSQPNCSYCVQITEEILQPMLISGNYRSNTIFSELEINTGKTIRDFNGRKVDATRFARRYNAWATPTLLFLDGEGNEIAEKMVGINTLELYGYYVDRSLKQGFIRLNP